MVANTPAEPSVNTMAPLAQRLESLQRQLDESGRSSKYPLMVSHGGTADFQITPSPTGDGTADIFMGDGAGGKLLRISTDAIYGTKIFQLFDQAGASMMSTDALAGFGWGTPSYPFVYDGWPWVTNLAGGTNHATSKELGRGSNFVYNPAVFVHPIVRVTSATNETVKIWCQFKDGQGNLTETADQTINVVAGVAFLDASTMFFGKNWQADDMNMLCNVFIKAYCTTANPGNCNVQIANAEGWGVSQRWYNDNAASWAV